MLPKCGLVLGPGICSLVLPLVLKPVPVLKPGSPPSYAIYGRYKPNQTQQKVGVCFAQFKRNGVRVQVTEK